jgi:hypothetical protein
VCEVDISWISNPFALTEAKLGKQIDWKKKSYNDKVDLVRNNFGMRYDELFDPKTGSPIFQKQDSDSEVGASDYCAVPAGYQDFGGMPYDTDKAPNFRDPVQGGLPDCWLVAAMASVVWTTTSANTSISVNQPASPFKFNFYNYVNYPGVTTKPFLPVDANKNIIYCRASNGLELWPSVCEKGYFQWRDQIAQSLPAPADTPDYRKYCSANALKGISDLTGKKVSSFDNPTDKYSTTTCFQNIYNNSVNYNRSSINRKIQTPAVAWTYDTNNLPGSYNGAFGDPVFNTSTLPACHCFSLLGTYGNTTDTGDKKYLVLRNPYGSAVGDPDLPGILTNISWCNIPLADRDGLFAISATEFVKKFQGYGWVSG